MRFLHHRPSPAIVISSVALFMSLGGVGLAATQLPNGSVGTAQLRNNAVTNSKINNNAVSYKKIQAGAVGTVRANLNQLQARVSASCGAGSAIGTIQSNGKVNCNSALPSEFGTTNNTAALFGGAPAAVVTSVTLPAGTPYLAVANPTATVTSGATARHVTVTCTLTVGSNTATRSATVDTTGAAGQTSIASIPLQATGPSGTASVSCSAAIPLPATATTVSVTSAVNAIQIA
ncbi:MAG: hypothetical protein WAL63_06805 [Solirubrobacteraceae bacterium]